MKTTRLLFLLLACGFLSAVETERIYLQSGSHLRIAIETCQARQGLTPLVVSLAGVEVEAVLDSQGRVFTGEIAARENNAEPLFTIDLQRGTADLGSGAQAIFIYEENRVRTRFWFVAETVELPLQLDRQNRIGTLLLGRMAIPAQVSATETVRFDSTARAAAAARRAESRSGRSGAAQLWPNHIRIRVGKAE